MAVADSLTPRAVRSTIMDLLPTGYLAIACAARRLKVSVRTLERRLKNSGTSYSALVDQVRYETACRLLATSNTNLAEVAAAIGYADPSSFSRAFARWSGMQPKVYRRARRELNRTQCSPNGAPAKGHRAGSGKRCASAGPRTAKG